MTDKVIVTAAITGATHIPSMSPYLPITPQEIADECVRAYDAGASVVHVHVRNPDNGQPTSDVEQFRQIAVEVKRRCNIILSTTTGGGPSATVEQRVAVVPALEPELASLNAGTMNFAPVYALLGKQLNLKYGWEREFIETNEDGIFPNTFKSMREYAAIFLEHNTKPEFEIYDLGMVNNVAVLLDRGHFHRPAHIQFVLGVTGGAAASGGILRFLHDQARESIGQFTWSVCAAGKYQIPMCTESLMMGGNVRVGMEDNLYIEKRVLAKSNAEQVEKIIRIARELGREPATPDEARAILGLKGLDKVRY